MKERDNSWQKISPEIFDETADTVSHHTKDIAGFIKEARYEDLTEEVIDDTKRLVLDTIACALTGNDVPSSKISREVVDSLGGKSSATIIGTKKKTSPPFAALVNAKAANAIDLDDCFMNLAHFAPQVVMSPLAVGESLKSSGKDYILSVAIGYEIAARIALAANFWKVKAGLVWGTGGMRLVFGANVFGAAVAAGKIFRLNEEELANTLGVCGYFAPVLIRSSEPALEPPKYCDAGYMAKYCDAGWSTFTGMMSAIYARTGFIANHYSLDGEYGYVKVMGGETANPDILTHELSRNQEHWYVSDSALKTHPCCKYVHNPLHLFMEIIKKNNIQVDDIEKVTVHLRPSHAIRFSDRNIEMIKGIPCTHNIPYNLAMAAFKIPPTQKWHAKENTSRAEVRKLMKKIFTKPSGEATLTGVEDIKKYGFPRRIFSAVDVYAKGKTFSMSSDKVKGDPWWEETRFTDDDLKNKFKTCAEGTLNEKKGDQIVDRVMNLEKLKYLSEITGLLTA